jgi:hypothetical protein
VNRLCVAFALLLALAATAGATNTSKDVTLQVTLHNGTVYTGRVRFKKTKLEVRQGKTRKIPYGDISSLSLAPPREPKVVLRTLERKRKRLDPSKDAEAWVRLARWANTNGLEDDAIEAYEAACEIDGDNEAARKGLGEIKTDDGWVDGRVVIATRRAKLKPGDHDARVELARFARSNGLRGEAFDLVCDVLRANIFHKDALRLAKPTTDKWKQSTTLRLPIQGRWKASNDRTRHHQHKSYAVYALDLTKVNEDGKHHSGDGRTLKQHYAYGAPFFAVADGKVVEVRDGRPDNPIGRLKGKAEKHNGVSIDHGGGEVSWYIHAKKGSLTVKVGDEVKAGQKLGEVGNSGGSAIPHLHFTLISFRALSVPWVCSDFRVIAPDGTPLAVERAWPREGWILDQRGDE